jgi:dihydrofolate reductase
VISRFLDEELVDEFHLFIVPVILREGIPLYTGLQREISLQLLGVTPYDTGIVKLLFVPDPVHRKNV